MSLVRELEHKVVRKKFINSKAFCLHMVSDILQRVQGKGKLIAGIALWSLGREMAPNEEVKRWTAVVDDEGRSFRALGGGHDRIHIVQKVKRSVRKDLDDSTIIESIRASLRSKIRITEKLVVALFIQNTVTDEVPGSLRDRPLDETVSAMYCNNSYCFL